MQPKQDRNEIFNCVRPQLVCRRSGATYKSTHMRYHMLSYIRDNEEEIRELLSNVLKERGMQLEEYVNMMENEVTCGYEATVLILAKMFKMKILVVRSDYLWLSESVEPINCDVVLVQNNAGLFYGTKGKNKFDIGKVPRIGTPKRGLEKEDIKPKVTKKLKCDSGDGTPKIKPSSRTDMKDTSTPKMAGNKQIFTFDLTMSPIEEAKNGSSESVEVEFVNDQKIRTERKTLGIGESVEVEKSNDQKIHTETKRLGIGGPSQKVITSVNKKNVSVSVQDIGKTMSGSSSVTVKKVDEVEKIVRFGCTKCDHWSFTLNGFHFHMFNTHNIRDPSNLSPNLLEGPNVSLSSDSSMPNIVGPSQRQENNEDEDKPYKCELCESRFFYIESIRTHMTHAHTEREEDKSMTARKIRTPQKTALKTKNISAVKPKTSKKTPKITLDDIPRRRTRSASKLIIQETLKKEINKEEERNLETSTELTKEDYVKSYSLRPRSQLKEKEEEGSENTDYHDKVNNTDSSTQKDDSTDKRENSRGTPPKKIDAAKPLKNKKETEKRPKENEIPKSENTDQDNKTEPETDDSKGTPSTPVDNTDDDPNFTATGIKTGDGSTPEETLTADSADINNNDDPVDEQKGTVPDTADVSTVTAESGNININGEDKDTERKKKPKPLEKKTKTKKQVHNSDVGKGKPDKASNSQGTNQSENTDNATQPDDDEDNFGYYCDKCNGKFTDWKEMKVHKLDCVKIPRKHICSVCNRGFQQKCLLQQHFDFYHTKKPKKFVCVEHKKTYVYKKSLQEHQRRDHSDGDYRYMCDFCGKGFFHLGEFTIHRKSVHLHKKDYMCNRCQQKAFSSVGRLNAHLEKCGNTATFECNICGAMLASKGSLFTHITDSHRDDIKYNCPICDDKSFNSQGGYYKHLRVKHNLSRSGVKISDIEKGRVPMDLGKNKNEKDTEPDNEEKNEDSNPNKRKVEGDENVSGAKKMKSDDQKPVASARKNTRSSGPTSWDCPLCEDKKYVVEDNYYKHLLKVHNINRQGNKVTNKKDNKGSAGNSKKK